MKTKKPILRLAVLAALSFFTGNEVVAQTTVGAACGCPNYATRVSNGVVNINTVGTWTTIPNAYGKELAGSQNILLTCDKIWQIDEKLYIGSGSTITIEPGTIIKGTATSSVAAARALIIERGGKIIAPGTQDCPIIFTADADDLSGSYGVINKGKWGGLLLCGKATNNLTLAANGPFVPGASGKLAVANGLGVLEGFASSVSQDWFGMAQSSTTGYTSATAPTGPTYSWSPNASIQNAAGTTTLKLSATNATIAVGMTVSGTGIAANTTVVSNVSGLVTLSQATTANMSGTYTFTDGTTSTTSTAAANYGGVGSSQVTLSVAPSWNIIGKAISGTGIAGSTTITAISGSLITLSSALTANASGALTITGTYPNPNQTLSYANVGTATTVTANIQGPVMYVNGTTVGTGQLVDFSQPAPQAEPFNDDDNSGVMTYVSIRNSGANLLVGSEINGLTLASVGRGTKIEHIEIVSCADDNIEIFGGTVNLKYCTTMFGNDDMFDYDLGWTGKAQFLFGMKANEFTTLGTVTTPASSGISNDSDNGFEMDTDDGKSYNSPKSTPQIYNATLIGNEKSTGNSDNSGLAAVMAKEYTGGEIRNSIFANFRAGFNMVYTMGSGRSHAAGGDAWHNWIASGTSNATASATVGNGSQSLKVKCNTFVGNTNALSLDATGASVGTAVSSGSNYDQFTTIDKNIVITTSTGLAGFDPSFLMSSTTTSNTLTTKNDVVPNVSSNVALDPAAGCPQAPMDGFFEPANYRGAFKPGTSNDNWLSDWSYTQVLGSTKGTVACPTDINNDGVTDVNDFLMFSQKFNQSCN
jgi:hypothetical protein